MEYPVWLVCGFLVPLSILPGFVRPISWALAPTWGIRAIRQAALGGSPLPELAICFGLGLGYATVGILLVETVLNSARRSATLSLT
jgi:ABC-2 type transport system permease protein